MEIIKVLIITLVASVCLANEELLCGTEDHFINDNHRAIVNTNFFGFKTIWSKTKAQRLTFCISKGFGNARTKIQNVMDKASRDWMEVANVKFIYLEAQDSRCNKKNNNVVFNVRKAPKRSKFSMRAFFPNEGRSEREVLINEKYVNRSESLLTGIMRHELGHVLGLRHEHIRPAKASSCSGKENNFYSALTTYDVHSVMHYKKCGGKNPSMEISEKDAEGIAKLYPF